MKNPWKKISSKIALKNPWYYVRQDKVIRPDGSDGVYNVIVSHPAALTVAVNKKQEVVIIGLFRYITGKYSLEIPGGSTEGQNPLAAAKRELLEETGLKAKKWKKLGAFQSGNGLMQAPIHAFLATELVQTPDHKKDEEGIKEVKMVPLKKVFHMIRKGEITDGESIVALTLAAFELGIDIRKA